MDSSTHRFRYPLDVSISSVGNRSQSLQKIRSINQQKDITELEEATDQILDDLKAESQFFRYPNPEGELPIFTTEEVEFGDELGRGEFGVVNQIQKFSLKSNVDACPCPKCDHVDLLPKNNSVLSTAIAPSPLIRCLPKTIEAPPGLEGSNTDSNTVDTDDEADDYGNIDDDDDIPDPPPLPQSCMDNIHENDVHYVNGGGFISVASMRSHMSTHVFRQGANRYAVKRLSREACPKRALDAALDLACEAEFLRRLNHPHIVKLRGTVHTPGHGQFMLILDRLYHTLEEKIVQWKALHNESGGMLGLHLGRAGRQSHREKAQQLVQDRLLAAKHIASALSFLHSKQILFRDLKPENVGEDVRGTYKIFDFGLARELKQSDFVEAPDGYNCTGLTGTRRYMAPEVLCCKPYGFSADVYAFGILFWQCLAMETPFARHCTKQLFEEVIIKGRRPSIRKIRGRVDKSLTQLLESMWAPEPSDRPTMEEVSRQLCKQCGAEEEEYPQKGFMSTPNVSTVSLRKMVDTRQ